MSIIHNDRGLINLKFRRSALGTSRLRIERELPPASAFARLLFDRFLRLFERDLRIGLFSSVGIHGLGATAFVASQQVEVESAPFIDFECVTAFSACSFRSRAHVGSPS